MICDAGAHRHRRKHPLPMSADYRQTHSRALSYPLLSTEKTISRPMAYSGKNPLSRICLFNCRKSGTPYGKPETCHRHDPNHRHRRDHRPTYRPGSGAAYPHGRRQRTAGTAPSREWKEPSGKSTDTNGWQYCHWICSGGRWI